MGDRSLAGHAPLAAGAPASVGGLVLLAMAGSAAATGIRGGWCAGDRYIWFGPDEAFLGGHVFCRYDPAMNDPATYAGALVCRTSIDRDVDTAEFATAVTLGLREDGSLAVDHLDGAPPEIWQRCEN